MYQGHHPDGSSVQQHSAGTHYPLVLRFRDAPDYFATEVLSPGGSVLWVREWTGQHDAAVRLWITRMAREWAQDRVASDRGARLLLRA